MRSSLAPGKSSTPPARCIHRPQRDTSSAGYRLLVSRASAGASRELSSRRSPAHPSSDRLRGSLRSGDTIPHTCAVSPTFRCGVFFFVPSALAALSSARLTFCYRNHAANLTRKPATTHKQAFYNGFAGPVPDSSFSWILDTISRIFSNISLFSERTRHISSPLSCRRAVLLQSFAGSFVRSITLDNPAVIMPVGTATAAIPENAIIAPSNRPR